MRNLLSKLWSKLNTKRIQAFRCAEGVQSKTEPVSKSPKDFQTLTEEDLYYCYRLLLQREPDPEGWQSWSNWIKHPDFTLQMLTNGFLYSKEYQQLQREANKPQCVDLDRFKIYVNPNDFPIGSFIARHKFYEPHVSKQLQNLLHPGHVFLDLGANIGYFTLLAASLVGLDGQVIAFEPNPTSCELIKLSIAENQFSNITLYPYAVAEKAQTFMLNLTENWSNGTVMDHDSGNDLQNDDPHLVQAVMLDDLLGDIKQIDLIKMDIEGAEPRAFEGMIGLIQQHRPIILSEFSPAMIKNTSHISAESYLALIHKQDYDIFILDEETGQKSSSPQNKQQIMNAMSQALSSNGNARSHLDLVAYPKGLRAPPTNQLTNQPTSQPTNQPTTNQPTNQPANQLDI